jgi:hypothetical protein
MMVPQGRRLIVLEPSKVGPQHITLLEGYLRALLALDVRSMGYNLVYRADPSSHAALAPEVGSRIPLEPIRVINPEQRRWIRKVGQEVSAVFSTLDGMGPEDRLLVTCLSSPSLLMLELVARFAGFGGRDITVVLHGEVEALFDSSCRSPRSWGFWSWRWSQLRRPNSPLALAVIADFIRVALARLDPARFGGNAVRLLPFPITPFVGQDMETPVQQLAAFIGYRTRFKDFDRFQAIASAAGQQLRFAAIGGGVVDELGQGERLFRPELGFLGEVAEATIAIFPYSQGYTAAMSAAALDALSTGVHIVATRRPCFVALQEAFGPDYVTVFDEDSEVQSVVADQQRLDRLKGGAAARRKGLARSPFGPAATEAAFRELLAPRDLHQLCDQQQRDAS